MNWIYRNWSKAAPIDTKALCDAYLSNGGQVTKLPLRAPTNTNWKQVYQDRKAPANGEIKPNFHRWHYRLEGRKRLQ